MKTRGKRKKEKKMIQIQETKHKSSKKCRHIMKEQANNRG